MDTDRNLLFAVLALQADLLDRDRFVQACTLWTARKDTPIADLLVAQGWLTPQDRADVQRLLDRKLHKHGGDARASLAEAAGPAARGALASVADPDVEQSLACLGGATPALPIIDELSTTPPTEGAGRNLLYEEIGRGGMGRVLRGRDPDLRRDLAVKILREEHRHDAGLERRFVEEAQIGGQLQHPGIVPVYELGRFADRRPYFTMKLVKGRTLADLLKERPDVEHDQPRFLTIFEQVCQTVAYAHSKGVIHRDLKPSNVMVGPFGEVQVMDWGLAKVLTSPERQRGDPEATTAASLIRTVRSGSTAEEDGRTGVVGTPAYMAPEQARGEVEAVDERADVFGLGAILCAILTGQPPYADADREAVQRKAAAGDLAGAFTRLDGCGADAELVTLCKECLAPERQGRPADAGAVAARVAAHQAAVRERLRRAELERAAAEARAVEERKRRRVSLALAAAVLALIAVGAGGGLLVQHQTAGRREDQARRDAEQRQTIEFALEKASGMRDQARWREATAVLEQARRVLGDASPDDLRQRLDVAEAELALVNRLDAIRQRRATIVEGKFDYRTASDDYATAFREAGLGEVGDDTAAVAVRVRATGIAGLLVAALDDWAYVALAAKEPESQSWLLDVARRADPDPWGDRFRDPAVWRDRQALQALADEALRDDGAKLGELSPQVLYSLGWRLRHGGGDAVPLMRAAQRRYPSDFWINLDLANALRNAKKVEEAVSYDRVAVALRPDAGAAHNNLGRTLIGMKDLDGAIAEYRKAIDLDPKNANAHNQLGIALYDQKDLDGAIAEFHKVIDIYPKYAFAHYNLGRALDNKKDRDGAIAEFQKAIDLDPKDAKVHFNLGNALYATKDLDGAIGALRKAIALDPNNAWAHYNLGNALSDKKDLDGAIAEYRKAIDIDPKDTSAHTNLRVALLQQGRFAEARTATQRWLELLPERHPWRQLASQQLQQCERLLALDEKLSAFLGGEAEPADAAERLALAQLCQLSYKRWHVAAARFYADAFAADPKLAADLRQGHRYNAACSAALAAAGQAEDAKNLPDKVQRMLRRQALGWLRADLALYDKLAERDEAAVKQFVRQQLGHWQEDADLITIRDKAALDKLPDDERRGWRQLWDDAAALLKKVEAKK